MWPLLCYNPSPYEKDYFEELRGVATAKPFWCLAVKTP
jgi:hypothetical protein